MRAGKRLASGAMSLMLVAVVAAESAVEADPEEDSLVQPAVIYGEDNRIDLYQIGGFNGAALRALAASTVALFEAENVTEKDGRAHLTTEPYAERNKLCQDEPFYSQRSGAFCSGSLVGPDLVMTAGHCVTAENVCGRVKFVFDFAIREKGRFPDSVPKDAVYGCSAVVAKAFGGDKEPDWALVRLDRKVADRRPLPIRRSGRIRNGAKIFVVGHPSGLPTKVAGGATVRDNSPKSHFVANLDTYGGNSGSAVFNALTGRVEGILVRGEQDFEWKGDCRVSKRCPDDGCSGEEVTKVSELASLIPGRFGFAAAQPRALPSLSQLQELSDAGR